MAINPCAEKSLFCYTALYYENKSLWKNPNWNCESLCLFLGKPCGNIRAVCYHKLWIVSKGIICSPFSTAGWSCLSLLSDAPWQCDVGRWMCRGRRRAASGPCARGLHLPSYVNSLQLRHLTSVGCEESVTCQARRRDKTWLVSAAFHRACDLKRHLPLKSRSATWK